MFKNNIKQYSVETFVSLLHLVLPLLDLPSALCCNRSCVSFQYAWLSFCLGFPIRFTLELINHTAYFYSWLLLPYIRYKHFRGWLFCPCIQRVSSYKLSCKSSLCHFFVLSLSCKDHVGFWSREILK